ncbi:MAG: acyltransferase, partial [Mycobacterium sp.]|nr:acyltransferase [Mycobacterium sp.]
MRVGPLVVGTLAEWEPSTGSAVSWQPSPAAREKAAQAPVSAVPVGYMQAQHIRGYYDQKAKGLDYSRLMIVSCDAPGRCDIRAMSYVINAHLRRHDTYRSWFE